MKRHFTAIEWCGLALAGLILFTIFYPSMTPKIEGIKTRAESDARQIAFAIAAYKADYQSLPYDGSGIIEFKQIGKILAGDNPEKKVYFESIGDYKNPWDKPYYIQMDSDYDSEIVLQGGPAGVIEGVVAVWTLTEEDQLLTSYD